MSVLAALALAPCLLLGAAPHARYQVELRTEGRAGTGAGAPLVSAALDILPRGGLGLERGPWELTLAYAPRLTFSNGAAGVSPNVLHQAELGAAYQLSPSRRFFLREDASYGVRDFSPLARAASPSGPSPATSPLDPLPALARAPYVSTATVLGLRYALSRAWSVGASAGYALSGGADAATRDLIPMQQGPSLDLQLQHQAGRSDSFTTQLVASDHLFSTGQRASVAQVGQSWERRLSESTRMALRAGVSVARGEESGLASYATHPVAGISVEAQSSLARRPLHLRVTADLVPYVDPLAGLVYQRVEGGPALAWLLPQVTLGARVTGSRVVTGWERRGQTLVNGDLGVSYLIERRVRLDAGLRGAFQSGLLVTGPALQWGAFAGLAFNDGGPL